MEALQRAVRVPNRARDVAQVAETEEETARLNRQVAVETFRNEVTTTMGGLSASLTRASQSVISSAIDSVRDAAARTGTPRGDESRRVLGTNVRLGAVAVVVRRHAEGSTLSAFRQPCLVFLVVNVVRVLNILSPF